MTQEDADAKPAGFDELVAATRNDRTRVRRLARAGRWRDAEPDPDRLHAFMRRRAMKATMHGAEAIVGEAADFQGVAYLTEGAQCRRAVAYVEVNDARRSTAGSGFLISPRLFITNCHVIGDVNAARAAQIIFDRETTPFGAPNATSTYLLDPDTFAVFSTEKELDYAVVAVGRLNSGNVALEQLGYCPLSDAPDRHVIGMPVNVIQHPRGLPKMIAIRNNLLTHRTDRTLLYETDTDEGSSGAPVFNDSWDVVALHHWGQPFLEKVDDEGRAIPVTVNEGVRISQIYRSLMKQLDSLPAVQRELLDEALSYARNPDGCGGKTLSVPGGNGPERLDRSKSAQTAVVSGSTAAIPSAPNEFRLVVPVEIIVRVGPTGPAASLAAAAPPAASTVKPKVLTRGPESLRLDDDYSNRSGYDPKFIPGATIPLPKPNAKLARQIAPLRAGEPTAEHGELKYEHFSLKMHKGKRLAVFTATNIDGACYLDVDRVSGRVDAGAEGERWFKDPRMSESFWTGGSFYAEWSNYFDKGHLTRRTDPTWGKPDEAERANADTFHWTNCSPQHFRFNESAKFWQGVERYVLENGALATDARKRIVVIQGPIFDDVIDHRADDLQIPSSFFKVIVWKGASGLKAVGLVVDQLALLDEQRASLGKPTDLSSVDVAHWRVAISKIEKRTGLSFGDTVRAADTITSTAQPTVGAEAIIRVKSFEDLLS